MKALLPILPGLVALLMSCRVNQPENVETHASDKELPPYSMNFQGIDLSEEGCPAAPCAHVSIQYPVLTEGENAEAINTDIQDRLRETIKGRLNEPMGTGSFEEMAQAFLDGYAYFKQEFQESGGKWFIEINSSKSVLTDAYFTLWMQTTDFMGGAHPNSYTMLVVYSLATGEQVDVTNLVDADLLRAESERVFRSIHKLSARDRLDDGGFFFPGGIFELPSSLGISGDGVVVLFNPYEYTSWEKGYTTFTIPWSVLTAPNESTTR